LRLLERWPAFLKGRKELAKNKTSGGPGAVALLEQRQAELESHITQLEAARESRGDGLRELNARQKTLAVPARVHKDLEAQRELAQVMAEIAALQTEDATDDYAITELREQLQTIKADIDAERWRLRCAPLCAVIAVRKKGELEGRIRQAAIELRDLLNEVATPDREVGRQLKELGFGLAAQNFSYTSERRGGLVAFLLKDVLESGFTRAYLESISKIDLIDSSASAFKKLEEIVQQEMLRETVQTFEGKDGNAKSHFPSEAVP